MSPVSTSSTVNLLDNQEPRSSSQESLTLQRRTTNVSTTLPRNKPNFFTNSLSNIALRVQHGDIIKDINEKIIELCDPSYLKNTSKEIIDQKMTAVEQLLSKLSVSKMKKWFYCNLCGCEIKSYFTNTVESNITLAEKIINIINSQDSYDITDLLEQPADYIKLAKRRFNLQSLINLYFKSDIKFADLKLKQIFIKHPKLFDDIYGSNKPSMHKDGTQKLLNIIDIAIQEKKINDNIYLTEQFYACLLYALENKNYSNIKKMLEYHHHFPVVRDYIETIVTINDPESLKLFAESKLPLYIEGIGYLIGRYITKKILPALSYAILKKKDDVASAIIELGINLNETKAYYKLGSCDAKKLCKPEGEHKYLADISYNASDNDEYTKETFLPPLFYAIFLRNHQIIDQLLAVGANKGYALEDIYNELEKDLRNNEYVEKILQDLRKDTSYNEEITAKLQQASILSNE